ncbi:hypothetical protein BpOF4_17860 [Alkalihalophilus pseudofirmus OF4]|uniref:Uncharacterized protein n=2 Tax=Alkalihalophilus pseudofirmus TaxID=79885 RepID=D3FRM2_ALKPO|nr:MULTISPECIES: hypothetical protein [Alkalihalophilus]ADC51613.1 hypothetical protein BpOF4_17860 [Alkalihalophilus pseudofirmus OF4]MDV2884847.1 hypothetical protein [Alkalihalophilus pseudofirmus]MED1603402.1 hypothetical protein [Alkalihalophilus marmarensis]
MVFRRTHTFTNHSSSLIDQKANRLRALIERNEEANYTIYQAKQLIESQSGEYIDSLLTFSDQYQRISTHTNQEHLLFSVPEFQMRSQHFFQNAHKRPYSVFYTYG